MRRGHRAGGNHVKAVALTFSRLTKCEETCNCVARKHNMYEWVEDPWNALQTTDNAMMIQYSSSFVIRCKCKIICNSIVKSRVIVLKLYKWANHYYYSCFKVIFSLKIENLNNCLKVRLSIKICILLLSWPSKPDSTLKFFSVKYKDKSLTSMTNLWQTFYISQSIDTLQPSIEV